MIIKMSYLFTFIISLYFDLEEDKKGYYLIISSWMEPIIIFVINIAGTKLLSLAKSTNQYVQNYILNIEL
jgi:hypothetical protein